MPVHRCVHVSGRQAAQAATNRQTEPAVVLGLDGEESVNDGFGASALTTGEHLRAEPGPAQIGEA